jgi:hypothetical protein
VFRDARFETLRIVYTKGDTIVANEGISSRMPDAAEGFLSTKALTVFLKRTAAKYGPNIYKQWPVPAIKQYGKLQKEAIARFRLGIQNRIARLGADGVYLIHNHPSGNPMPSKEDRVLTMGWAERLPQLKGHVVINSGAYSVITPTGDISEHRITTSEAIHEHSKPHAILGHRISGPDDLMRIGKQMTEPGGVTIIYATSRKGYPPSLVVRAIETVPESMLMNDKNFPQYLHNRQVAYGGRNVFLYGEPQAIGHVAARKLFASGQVRDLITSAGESIHESFEQQGIPLPQHRPLMVTERVGEPLVQEMKQEARRAADVLWSARDSFRKVFNPTARGPVAKTTALMVRERGAERQRSLDQVEHAVKDARKMFAAMPEAERHAFIDNMEHGRPQPTPELDNVATLFREVLDRDRREVQALGTGKLKNFIDTYVPRYWKKGRVPSPSTLAGATKSPLEGSKAFLKRRSYTYFMDGINAGETPLSDNPVDFLLWKHAEMQKYIEAHRNLNELKSTGTAVFAHSPGAAPDGWTTPKDNLFAVWSINDEGELVKRGDYYLPEEATRIIDNYTSRGLRGNDWFRAYLGASNAINQLQLGLSAFHLGFVALDSIISNNSLALHQAAHGHPISAAATLARSLPAPLLYAMKGRKMRQEWLEPGTHPGLAPLVEAWLAGGGRSKMDTFYQQDIGRRMADAFRQSFGAGMKAAFRPTIGGTVSGGLVGGLLGGPAGAIAGAATGTAVARAIGAAIRGASAPVMEHAVPNMKAGAIAYMAAAALRDLGPNASQEQVRKAMAEINDSVDNRMGQMIYDNLFWEKAWKDLGMASVRSLGWNLGDIREFLGGGVDWTKFVAKAGMAGVKKALGAGGNMGGGGGGAAGPEFTQRMAYTIMLPFTVGLFGAVLTYLFTGKGPEKLEDYFYVKTGNLDENGDPERVLLPSYMKDIMPLVLARGVKRKATTLLTMASHKLHPMLNLISQMLQNRDYFGTEIRNEDDPIVQQLKDTLSFAAKTATPFGIAGVAKEKERGATKARQYLPLIGITPAPRAINQTPAQQLMAEMAEARRPIGTRTKAEAEKAKLKAEIVRGIRKSDPEATARLKTAEEAGAITSAEGRSLREKAAAVPVSHAFKPLSADDALKVWDVANEKERAVLKPLLEEKAKLIEKLPHDEQPAMTARFAKALGSGPEEVTASLGTPEERSLREERRQIHEKALESMESNPLYQKLSKENQERARDRLNGAFAVANLSSDLTGARRTQAAARATMMLRALEQRGKFEQKIREILNELARRRAA